MRLINIDTLTSINLNDTQSEMLLRSIEEQEILDQDNCPINLTDVLDCEGDLVMSDYEYDISVTKIF